MTEMVNVFGRQWAMPKRHFSGTHRVCSPRETLDRLQPIQGTFGITRLANVTGLDTIGLPVWVAARPNSRGLSTSQGKGLTHEAAKVSALMESIEGWHGENIDLPLRHGSPEALAAKAAMVDYRGLSHYAGLAPREDTPLHWVEGWNLVAQEPCLAPFEAISTNYVTGPSGYLQTTFVQSSNGLAGGNHIVEAITHALFEVIERDAVARAAHLLRSFDSVRRVDPATVIDPDCRTVIDLVQAAGVALAILDLTCDTRLPVFAVTIVDVDADLHWRSLPSFSGYGCHLQPGIALLRAINEAVQSRLTYISGSRDDISYSEYRRGGNADALKSLRSRLSSSPCERDFAAVEALPTRGFGEDICAIIDRLRAIGIDQVIAVDLTKPEHQIPVVKVVVPWLAAPAPMIRGRNIVIPARDARKWSPSSQPQRLTA